MSIKKYDDVFEFDKNRIIKCNNDRLTSIFDLNYPTSRSVVQTLVGEQE